MAERITFKEKDGSYNSKKSYYVLCNKLATYEDLEEQGKLLKLPCKVGDKVFYIYTTGSIKAMVIPCRCREIRIFSEESIDISLISEHEMIGHLEWHNTKDIGKTVFLTQTEAEEALQKMNETEE